MCCLLIIFAHHAARSSASARFFCRSRLRQSCRVSQALTRLFPNHVELHAPHIEAESKAWKKMVDADVAAQRTAANRVTLRNTLAK